MTHPTPRARAALRRASLAGALLALAACASAPTREPRASDAQPTDVRPADAARFMLVVHGGAGTIRRESMTAEEEAAYRATLDTAIRAGYAILAASGRSLDAVVAVVNVLEDSPLFNAGRGAVFTHEGRNEMDAAIMSSRTLGAGAVAGVRHIRHPIDLARAVMEKSPHVMLTGDGAEEFARTQGFEMMPEDYFRTERRWRQLERARAAETRSDAAADDPLGDRKFGTVGAVALDVHGDLAAATSTGGMTNKRWGRVGDAPIIGAGTYADSSCAVSATGHGEYFIRNIVAADICARVRYAGATLEQAAEEVVMRKLVAQGGEGGVIAVDHRGNIALPFNSSGMYRGWVGPDGTIVVKIYRD
ncbi:MAG TPA: isoaspartyl peptidase/L-asparaginase [Gemmatimonadaceae bacterium]